MAGEKPDIMPARDEDAPQAQDQAAPELSEASAAEPAGAAADGAPDTSSELASDDGGELLAVPADAEGTELADPEDVSWSSQAANSVYMPQTHSKLPIVIIVIVVLAMAAGIAFAAHSILDSNEFRAPQAEQDLQKVEPSVRELRERGIDPAIVNDDENDQPGVGLTVCIDAGHSAEPDATPSSANPYSNTKTPTEPGGATGSKAGPEYKITLDVAKRLRTALESYGFKVVMVREGNKVTLSPKKRAKIANKCKADLFIRLHCDGASASESGFYTLMPGKAGYQAKKKRYKKSQKIAKKMHKYIVKELGGGDRGTAVRTDLGGFNWCKRPAVLFEMGNLANAHDDKLLAKKKYRQKLANAITHATVEAIGR